MPFPDADRELVNRLRAWGCARDWELALFVEEFGGQFAAKMGPITGFGRTMNEAVNNLADGLVEEGWQDNRS